MAAYALLNEKEKKLETDFSKHSLIIKIMKKNIGHMVVIICVSCQSVGKSYFGLHCLRPHDEETSDQGSSPPEIGPEDHDRL